MKRYELITPEGTRDLLFEECLARREVEKKFADIYKSFGYSEVVTTGIEFYDLFTGGSRNLSQESMYKLVDSKGRLLVMRPDSTIPIARLVATRLKDQILPLRLYYVQRVYENNALLKGRSDEIVQTGIELIGFDSKRADYEVLCLAVTALTAYKSLDFRLELGDIGIFNHLVDSLDCDKDTKKQIRQLIDSKSYPVLNDLLDSLGENKITSALKQLPSLFGGIEVLDKAHELCGDETVDKILDKLRLVYTRLSSLGYGDKISFDLGIVNRTKYYTGIVFQGYLAGCGEAVLQGGRYNKLLGEFGYDVPSIGFAINADAVAKLLLSSEEAPAIKPADCIVWGGKGYVVEAIKYARQLTEKGLTVENGLQDTLDEAVEYAKNKGIKEIIVVTKDEISSVEVDSYKGENA